MRYKEYKKVDLPWLDEVPSHWELARLKNYIISINGYAFSSSDFRDFGIRVIRISDFNESGFVDDSIVRVDEKYYNKLKKFQVKNKDIILCLTGGTVGKYYFVDNIQEPMLINQRVGIIRNKDSMDSKFLKYLVSSNIVQTIVDFSKNSLNDNISLDVIERIKVPIPPKEEQEQIARFLDWKINETDMLIYNKEKQIKNIERTRRVLIIDTMLNNDYKRVMLSRCASENKRKNINSNQNLLSLSYGKIIRKDINSTFGLLPEKFDKYQLVDKSNIILRLTDLQNDHKSLRVGLVEETGIITSAYIGLICNNSVLPEYLYYYLNAMDLRKDFYSMGAGVRQNLNYNELKKIIIRLPDKDKQKYIIDYLNENEYYIKKFIKSKEKQINNLKLLKQSLISDVVTGKLDVRNIFIPDYEKVNLMEEDIDLEESFEEEV